MDRDELLAWIDSLCFVKYDPELEWEGQELAAEWLRVLLEETKPKPSGQRSLLDNV